MIHYRKEKVRFEGPGNMKGKAIWELVHNTSDPSVPAIISLRYPDGSRLLPEQIAAVDQVEDRMGWQDPRTILKTAGLSVGAFLLCPYVLSYFFDVPAIEEADEALKWAVEDLSYAGSLGTVSGEHIAALEEALKQVTEADRIDPGKVVGLVAGAGLIAVPSAYAGYALSRRRIRLQMRLESGEIHTVQTPEHLGIAILGAFQSAAGIRSGEQPAPEAATPSPA